MLEAVKRRQGDPRLALKWQGMPKYNVASGKGFDVTVT
jgi:hypothetical protein